MDKKPTDFGYNSSTWTAALLIKWFKEIHKIDYKDSQIYNLLHKLKLSFQKGKGYYPEIENCEEKVEELKKNFKKKEKNIV